MTNRVGDAHRSQQLIVQHAIKCGVFFQCDNSGNAAEAPHFTYSTTILLRRSVVESEYGMTHKAQLHNPSTVSGSQITSRYISSAND